MSEYSNVYAAAMLGTYEDFLKLYKRGDEKKLLKSVLTINLNVTTTEGGNSFDANK